MAAAMVVVKIKRRFGTNNRMRKMLIRKTIRKIKEITLYILSKYSKIIFLWKLGILFRKGRLYKLNNFLTRKCKNFEITTYINEKDFKEVSNLMATLLGWGVYKKWTRK